MSQSDKKPWIIARLGATDNNRVVGRYVNRRDAEDDLRSLKKFVKNDEQYVVCYDSED